MDNTVKGKNAKKPGDDFLRHIREKDDRTDSPYVRLASYITLANGKDSEMIRLERELRQAHEEINALKQRIAELEPLEERVKFLEGKAGPVLRFESSPLGKVYDGLAEKLKK